MSDIKIYSPALAPTLTSFALRFVLCKRLVRPLSTELQRIENWKLLSTQPGQTASRRDAGRKNASAAKLLAAEVALA